jgi:hypothetical protein
MRISDVFTMGGDFGHDYGGYGGYGGYSGYSGYACYGDFNRYCFSGSRPFRAPIQVEAPDLYGKEDHKAY